jgi:hypothetical protein
MLCACYVCLILVKIGIYLQILVKIQNMEFYENLHRGVALYHVGRRTASCDFLQLVLLTAILLLQICMKLILIWSYMMQIIVMMD